MIPKTIFQTWKSKTEFPENFAYWSSTAKLINPGYDHVIWDDDDNRRLIADHYPWFLDTYNSFPAEIYRADAVRPFFLYHHGGFYADMDVEFLRPLDDLMLDAMSGVLLGSMGVNPAFEHSIPNATMASSPGMEFWLLTMALMMESQHHRPEYTTGPVMLKNAHDLYTGYYDQPAVQDRLKTVRDLMGLSTTEKSDIYLASGNVFFPLDWNDCIHDQFRRDLLKSGQLLDRTTALGLFPRSVTATYWTHTWEPQQL